MSPSSVCARRHFHVGPVSAGLENLPRALDPRRILFPQSTLPSFRCPARNNSARVPSPMDGADASSPARGQRIHWTLAFRLPRAASATSPAHSASSHSTEHSAQHSHSIPSLACRVHSFLSVSSESPETPPPPPFLAREFLSSPVNSSATVRLRRSKATRSFLSTSPSDPGFLPANPTLHQVSPTSSSSTPTTPTAERLLPDVHVDEPSLGKPPHLPLLFPRSYG